MHLERRCTSVVLGMQANEPRPSTKLACDLHIYTVNVVASCKVFDLLCVASLTLIFTIAVSTVLSLTIARNPGRKRSLRATHRANVAKGSKKECASHVTQLYSRAAAQKIGSSLFVFVFVFVFVWWPLSLSARSATNKELVVIPAEVR